MLAEIMGSDPRAHSGSARGRNLFTPLSVHVVTLVAAAAFILVLGRTQWFFGDDWAILAPRLDGLIFAPHVGHWNLVPALVFPLLRETFGLGSYLPFLVPVLVVHLAVTHLTWRLCLRSGVHPWAATGLATMVAFLGAGAENILWAFQFGFIGAIALGLLVVLLIGRARPSIPAIFVATVAALVAPMFSGTAIPVLAAAAVAGVVKADWWRTAIVLAPAAITYLTWFTLVGRFGAVPSAGIHDPSDVLGIVAFAAAMIAGGLGRGLPWIGLGVVPALGIAVWFVATVRRAPRSAAWTAYALVIGAVVFVLLTAWSRHGFGITAAATPRYAYLTIVLLVPAFGLIATAALRRSWGRPLVVTSLVLLILTNIVLLVLAAQEQAALESGSRERVLAALDAVREAPHDVDLLRQPADPVWAPDLLGEDLLELARRGQFR